MNKIRNYIAGVLMAVGVVATLFAATPTTITFQATLSSQSSGVIQGRRDVVITIYDGNTRKWVEIQRKVTFVNGTCSIVLGAKTGNPLSEETFNSTTPRFGLKVQLDPNVSLDPDLPSTYFQEVFLPVPAAAYSIQSKVAEVALQVDASKVQGAFTSTVNMQNDLIVGNAFVVRNQLGRVGIGINTPNYTLDVAGAVNASSYTINGNDLETALFWKKRPNSTSVYFDTGFVGIGTSRPNYVMDVVGTVNANQFTLQGVPIADALRRELSWQPGPGLDIYYDDGTNPATGGYVGIGTTDPTEKLDVRGSIRIAKSLESSPALGTIQYDNGDFQGYTSQGWVSLTGIQGNGRNGQLSFWTGTNTLSGSDNLFWDNTNSRLGIGLSNPTALLMVKGQASSSTPLVDIQTSQGKSALFVDSNGKVGIGSSVPNSALDVNGVVNATDFRINGQPLNNAISSDSFWLRENFGRLFYDLGFVGIGTTTPRNMLEIASVTGNPTITFDIAGGNMFSLGIDQTNPDSFIIGKGGDLNTPVFTFKGENIGIGLKRPSANLHVSGNSGVVFTGTYGSGEALPEQGRGTKMIWYPAKAAFRVGHVLFDEWDQANLADYSVGMGYNPKVTGLAGTVAGGYKNTASGQYATVAGGFQNTAAGNYSFAAGYQANALQQGTFVWSDYVPTATASAFRSSLSNQFLIRAYNGVGIGTSDTSRSALTIARNVDKEFLIRGVGFGGGDAFTVTTSGNVGIGTSRPGVNRLAVPGGPVSIGTTIPRAALTVQALPGTRNIIVFMSSLSPTPAMFITASGNVGIGVPLNHPFSAGDRLAVGGNILASTFKVVDPNNPSATITITPNPGSPWSDPEKNPFKNTFRTQGKIGIGTPSPNSLLELSNRGLTGTLPVITFDINGIDRYSVGVTSNVANTGYVFMVNPGSSTGTRPPFIVSTSSIGVNIGLNNPRAALHVSGNMIVSGNMAIGTSNLTSPYRLNVAGGVNVSQLYIGGTLFAPIPNPWKTQGLNIYYTSGNVGIGISSPINDRLTVRGTVSANSLVINKQLQLLGDLNANNLYLKDANYAGPGSRYGFLFVDNGEFKYTNPSGNTKIISSPLQKGTGNNGYLAYWVDNSTLGMSTIFWDKLNSKLNVSGNLTVTRYRIGQDIRATSSITYGGTTAASIVSQLSHDGNLSNIKGYTGQSVVVNIDKNWGNSQTPVTVKGLDITMRSRNSAFLLNDAAAVGLMVDVASVNVNTAENGHKYAAIFKGGNVGIGTTRPVAELEVSGTVSANYFNLSGGLNVPTLVVNKSSLVARSTLVGTEQRARVGIGITDPETRGAELYVNGMVSANALAVSGGIESVTMNINKGTLYVDASGNIGLGTTQPNGQLDIKKSLTGLLSGPFTSQKMNISINSAQPGNVFFFNKNLTGLDMNLQSSSVVNKLDAKATGMRIDLSKLQMDTNGKAYGLDVDVTGTTGTRYAAIFQGGFVGIGTSNPTVALDVVGTINATNLFLRGNLEAKRATFNYLMVNKGATFNGTVTVNSLYVRTIVTANNLVLKSALNFPTGTFATLNAQAVSVNSLLKTSQLIVRNTLTSNTGVFTTSLGVGTTAPVSGLLVSGNIQANSLSVLNGITLEKATFNIRNQSTGETYMLVNPSGKVGIGTSLPSALLHIQTPGTAFTASDTSSWGTVRLQTQTNFSNTGTGLLFLPDNSVNTRNVGSGIIGLRASDFTGLPSSHLVFVTDPLLGAPQERMRITSEGNVGIGTTLPSSKLDVAGNMNVSGNLTLASYLQVGKIQNTGPITINPNSLLTVNGGVSVNNNVQVQTALYIKEGATVPASSPMGALYVSSVDKNLYFLRPNSSSPVNITGPLTGGYTRVPYYDSSGNLSSNADLYWDPINRKFGVGTANAITSMELTATVNNGSTGSISGQKIELGFADRSLSGLANNIFTGMDIEMKGTGSGNNFGRLGQGETALGLKVDMRNLKALQYTGSGTPLVGYKYSAVFLGGGVGIGTTSPGAGLHVVSETTGGTVLRVDTRNTANVLVVAGDGQVGVGTSTPRSKLMIKGDSAGAGRGVFEVTDSTNKALLKVLDTGRIGIGTSNPSSNLHVVGVVSANNVVVGGLVGTTMNIGNGALYVTATGSVGVGTTTPMGNIGFYKAFVGGSPAADYVMQRMDVGVGSTLPGTQFFFDKNITGMQVNLKSNVAASFLNATAVGVSINMSQLTLGAPSGKAIGVYVDVAGTTGTRYSGVFLGGNVGIGTTTPTSLLDVAGDVKANALILSGGLTAGSATFNTLTVSSVASFNGSVTVNRLAASIIDATAFRVNGTLTVTSANFVTVNATSMGSFGKLGIGVVGVPKAALEVNGNALFRGGVVTMNGVVNVSDIRGPSGITVNAGSGSVVFNAIASMNRDLRVGGGLYLNPQSTTPAVDPVRSRLYVDSTGQLNYSPPNSASIIKISKALTGVVNRVPYYDNTGNLSASANLIWNPASNLFQIGAASTMSAVEVRSTLNPSTATDYVVHKVQMSFGDRAAANPASARSFQGLNILFAGDNPSDPNNFGRLGQNETATGLNIDVSTVRAKYSTTEALPGDTNLTGYKYAAVFKGGSVGIGTSTPLAALHLINESVGVPPLKIDTTSTPSALVVAANGFVGIGTSAPLSRLTLKADTNNSGIFELVSSKNASLIKVTNDGRMGFGTTQPSANLHVISKTGVTPFKIQTNGNPAMIVSDAGYMGVGLNSPSANLHVVGTNPFRVGLKNGQTNALVVGSNGYVGVGTSTPAFPLNVEGIVMSGTSNVTSIESTLLPNWILNTSPTTRGFLANNGIQSTFLGVRQKSGSTYDSVFWWGPTGNVRFEHYNGSVTTNVMVLNNTGKVGIGTLTPSANLHLKGSSPLWVSTPTQPNAMYVDSTGKIGIGTTLPSANLHVNGSFIAKNITVSKGTVAVSTLNLTGQLSIATTVTNNAKPLRGHSITMNISADRDQDLVGLGINVVSLDHPDYADPSRRYVLYRGAAATGLKVDLSQVQINDPVGDPNNNIGRRIAASFMGGGVGIGIEKPTYPLHIFGEQATGQTYADLARFGSLTGDLSMRDFGSGKVGFIARDVNTNAQATYLAMTLTAGTTSGVGRVGIGTSAPDKELVVNGDIRLGSLTNTGGAGAAANYGNKLYFSGGPDVQGAGSYGSENNVPLWMGRYNAAAGQSELRVNVGTVASDTNKFVVGYDSGTFKPVLDIRSSGKVAINNTGTAFNPDAPLHVKTDVVGASDRLSSYATVIENTGGDGADSLAIHHSNANATFGNYISFFNNTTMVGAVKQLGQTGVQFITYGADYAEYLPRINKKELIQKGDLVGVINGQISKNTSGAQQVMVKSTTAGVAGNWPGKLKEKDFDLVAFFGQVPVKVRGAVKKGDFILPSGLNDGTGKAVPASAITHDQWPYIVGTAWEESDSNEVKLIRVAVGFSFSQPSFKKQVASVVSLKKDVETLQTERKQIVDSFESRLEAQNNDIEALMKDIQALKK